MADHAGLLNEEYARLRNRGRSAIEDLRSELAGFGASKEDLDRLRQAARDLDELFMLVVVGEFNSGKSALINALVGEDVLEEGVTPTTSAINILKHGPERAERWVGPHVLEREYPHPLLRDVAIVDTPGTNAVLREHQELTEHFVPRSDLVLFVTSVERPFTESERAFLEAIRGWGKKVVLVLNKVDLLRSEAERQEIIEYLGKNVRALLGFRPQVLPVSARRAKETGGGDPDFEALRGFLTETLTAEDRVRLKLTSPLSVASTIAERYRLVARHRLDVLTEDARTGQSIERQIGYYQDEMRSQIGSRLHEVENIVYDLSQRADRFFDETFRIARIFDLINADKVRGEFEREVVANTAERIDQSVDSIARWVVDREIQLWEGVLDELSRRRQVSSKEIILGDIGGNFESSRREMIQNISRSARQVLAGFDRAAEARVLGDTMREAVAQTALAEAGAVGLGALVVGLLGTAAADVTGILAGAVVASLGLYIIPMRKARVQKKFRERADDLRLRLRDALSRQLNSELASSVERILSAVAPYMRFVRSEQEKVSSFHDRMAGARDEMGVLVREIGAPSFEG